MADLPVMLRVAGRRCVVVGGGAVAARRATALLAAGAKVTVVAPEACDELQSLPVEWVERRFEPYDLENAILAVAATDDAAVNEAIAVAARERGVLINRADDPQDGDVVFPAHDRVGPVTVCVHTDGISAAGAAAIRDQLLQAVPESWITLLTHARAYRQRIQERFAHDEAERLRRLRLLGSDEALERLEREGEQGLIDYFETLAGDSQRDT